MSEHYACDLKGGDVIDWHGTPTEVFDATPLNVSQTCLRLIIDGEAHSFRVMNDRRFTEATR